MSRYARLVAKYRRLAERLDQEAPPPALVDALRPGILAALAAIPRLAGDPAWQAGCGGELVSLFGEPARRHAREIAARTLAALDLAGATGCPHLGTLPGAGVHSIILLDYRTVACPACVRAMHQAGVAPDPADADRCDWCGDRGVTTFHPVVVPLGPSVVFGDACPACHRALAGPPVQPKGRG